MSQSSNNEPKTPKVGLNANSYVQKNAQVSLMDSNADFLAKFWANDNRNVFANRLTVMPALSANETEVLLNDSDFDENYDDITVVMPTVASTAGTKYPYVLNMDGMDKKPLSPPKLTRKKARIIDSDEEEEETILVPRKKARIVDSDEDEEVVKLEDIQHHELGYEVQAAAMALSDGDLMDPVTAPKNIKKRKSAPAAQADGDDDDIKPKDNGSAVQRYCFTYNNPTVSGDDFDLFLKTKAENRGHVFQLEEGEEGTPHFQGYLELEKRMRTTGVHKMLAPHKMSLLHAKGSKVSNKKYCTKENGRKEGPWIYGSCEDDVGQGKRNELNEYAEDVLENDGITDELIERMPGVTMRYQKHARELVQLKRTRAAKKEALAHWKQVWEDMEAGREFVGQQQRHLELYFGPTAVGKTTRVKAKVAGKFNELLFEMNCATKWWDGYEGEKHVLMDEFQGDRFGSPEDFNRITNKGVVKVEKKGESCDLVADALYFTSNRHPCHWWKAGDKHLCWKDARYRAVARRFATVYWWNDAKELVVLQNPGPEEDTDEWKATNAKWKRFWEWKERPLQAGDNYVPTDESDYFTLP